eukprot:CAMPEP_0185857460 /NCGR_PEP_ID=MMETSP1354-20130828/29520_1 /TAXON_ID=708628 /ORGANISM="Erythrolobus madagascarensis, Strain CCMP3276" /LENGTH=231 /DNA_ID=CAMNT_0028559731 /DNA_START=86 /DNA_END=778 /DNA_ORIENTATION=-
MASLDYSKVLEDGQPKTSWKGNSVGCRQMSKWVALGEERRMMECKEGSRRRRVGAGHGKFSRSLSDQASRKIEDSARESSVKAAPWTESPTHSEVSGCSELYAPSNKNPKKELYKTEMCRSWTETGTCRYGVKCQFAHGREELRSVTRHPKYKTKMCKNFSENGSCPYGVRCRFIHDQTRGNFEGLDITSLLMIQGLSADQQEAHTSRLPIFQTLDHEDALPQQLMSSDET